MTDSNYSNNPHYKKVNTEFIEIKKSKIHGTGVFASKDIPKGTKVIEYVGEIISKEESDKRADAHFDRHKKDKENNGAVYIFELNDTHDIDGDVPWNPAKYINHSCDPNCETEITNDEIWIVSIKDIKKGEEISYNYCYDIDDFEEHPCRCGSEKCPGYIVDEEYWPKLRELIEKKKSEKQ